MGKWRDGLSLRKKSLVFRLCARLNYLADIERGVDGQRQTLQPVRVSDGLEPELDAILVGDGGSTTVLLKDIRRLKVLGTP